MSSKRKALTLEVKLDILKRFDRGQKAVDIAKALTLPLTTVKSIRNRDASKIKESAKNSTQLLSQQCTRNRPSIMVKMVSRLTIWIQEQNYRRMPLCKMLIKTKAKLIFDSLKLQEPSTSAAANDDLSFEAIDGWFARFKSRGNLHNLSLKGEAASSDSTAAEAFPEKLKKIIQDGGYCSKQIFNVDETDVDIKRNRQQEGKKRYCNSIKAARRHSIGGAREEVMNSHTAAINLQSAGHRGFPQVASTTGNTSECPWYMPHQMPPTAPVRQHKRPAPQPGSGVSNVGNSNLTQTTVASTHSCTAQNSTGPPITHPHPPVTTIAAHTVTTQQQQLQNVSMIPPQLPPHTTNMNQNFNPSHLSTHQLSSQVATQQHNTTNTSISPKSPNQQQLSPQSNIHLMQSTAVTTQQSSVNQQQPQSLQLQQASSNNISSATPNLMSTSLNSVLLQNLTSVQSGNNGGGSNCNLGILGGSNNISGTQPPSINVPPIMSTSLHGANFDSSNITWNSSSLSPTLPTQRKCEGKLNGMPWFHGSITREEAENLLQPREDGLFLVRESTNFPGDYTLCVCFQGKVEHYRVKRCNGKLTIDDEEFFEHLGQLVAHYENDADGLCTQLKRCLQFRAASAGKEFEGWIIPEADIQLRDHIGKGEFGNVVLGIYKNEKVAVKMLKDDTAAQKFLQEASVMTTLEHENLVKFIGIVLANHIYLVTEYMSKGSLVDYLRSRGRQHITKKDQINFACDTCSGMEYLENKKVIHRDLAARNVLISESCVAKVADFGLARGESYNLHVVKLPIKWTAPESLKEGKFSNKSDMWSFGILLWEIYSFGRVPYPRIPLDDVVRFVENNYKMEAPEGCPNEIYEMMKQAWDLNPARRPSFHELKPKLLNLKNMHSASELIEQK